MAEVDILIDSIRGARLQDDAKEYEEAVFDVSASLVESERSQEMLTLKFSIDMEAQPSVAKISVSGSATIRGESGEIQKLTSVKDQRDVPTVFMKLYQRIYPVVYLLAGSLRIPYPAPGLLMRTHLSSSREVAQIVTSEGGNGSQ